MRTNKFELRQTCMYLTGEQPFHRYLELQLIDSDKAFEFFFDTPAV
jgi:hypothetical protein